jgi:restriction system protein
MSTKGDQFGGAAAFIVAAVIGGIALADNPDTGIDDWLIVGAIVIGLSSLVYLHNLYEKAKQRRRDLEYVQSGMAAIDSMTGVEFENYVAARFRQAGWKVSTTAASGDFGVDLIAKNDGQCMVVQCKRYGKSVEVSAVQQVVAGAMRHQCTSSMVVSNQEFTKAAKQLAITHNCQLIGRAGLPNWAISSPATRGRGRSR